MALTVWHNPRCSKSRQALALLTERGIEFDTRAYLDAAPTHAELAAVIAKLGRPARDLIRAKEARETGVDLTDEAAILAAMVDDPRLIERPVLISETAAAIGRPPENILTLL